MRLIRTAARCNKEATRTLCERFAGAIHHAVSRFAASPEDREDLHSDVIVRLLADEKRALRNWRPRAPFAAYVSSIAANHCIDWLRAEGKLPPAHVDPAAIGHGSMIDLLQETLPAPAHESPEAALDSAELRRVVEEALAGLNADDRLILLLRYEQEMSGPEIASALGLSHTAARQRLFRALRRLEGAVDRSDVGA